MTGISSHSSSGSPFEIGGENRLRGQANLVALVGALFALTTAMVVGVAVADNALAGATGEPAERRVAVAVADRLVAASSPLTNRTNVVNASAVDEITAPVLRRRYPALRDRSVRVTLGDNVLVDTGSVTGGARMQRIVLTERVGRQTITPNFSGGNRVSIPRRTPDARLTITPPDNVTVSSVRANARTVLHRPSGLRGTFRVNLSRRETVSLTFVANRSLSRGDVAVTIYPSNTTKSTLSVTLDD